MRGIPTSFLSFFFALIILVEICSYIGFRILIKQLSKKIKKYFSILYLFFGLAIVTLLFYAFSNPESIRQSRSYTFFFILISISFLNLFPKSIFAFSTLLSFPIRWLISLRGQSIVLSGSLLISTAFFLILTYGILFGRYNLRVENQNLYFKDLPEQLNGFKIVQISDIHLGSYGNNESAIVETIKITNEIKPDLLLFTGDMVNNFENEFDAFESDLKKLSGKYGKFAIMGNHDYGDYYDWPDTASKRQNLKMIENQVRDAGFKLLLNQWEKITVQDTSFSLIGVENWGHRHLPQYADLDLAMKGIPENSFKILMSHEPAHWEAEVVHKTDIPLTLSGHTHGGQFAIKIAGIEFSPIYFIQKLWGGLYQSDNQFLYVNRGLGTVGFPGRIDMRPEITLLTLYRSKNR